MNSIIKLLISAILLSLLAQSSGQTARWRGQSSSGFTSGHSAGNSYEHTSGHSASNSYGHSSSYSTGSQPQTTVNLLNNKENRTTRQNGANFRGDLNRGDGNRNYNRDEGSRDNNRGEGNRDNNRGEGNRNNDFRGEGNRDNYRGEGGWRGGEGGWRGGEGGWRGNGPYIPPYIRPVFPYVNPYVVNPYYVPPYKYGKRDVDKSLEAECRFFPDTSMLSCNGNIVLCEAATKFEGLQNSYQMYGIGSIDKNVNVIDTLRFKLYPKNLTDLTYLDMQVPTTSGKLVDLYLYQSDRLSEYGIMIKDRTCYKKLVEFFSSVTRDLVVDKMENNKIYSKLSLLGYVLYV